MVSIKLYLDEMIPIDLTLILKQYNYDVLSARDAGMLGKNDLEQLVFTASQGRAILTFNIGDFTRLHKSWLVKNKLHKGIIVSPEIKTIELARLTLRLLAVTRDGEIDNQLRFLQEFY
ncbi:MAG: DUF5615 family PIN-like protein [Nitrospiraceae bacterium]|nr:DUF5615 family PIN-like protein [Nitrospiraceae bacterium]